MGLGFTMPVLAQDAGNGGGRGGGGRRTAEEMRQRAADRMKEALGANDEEWKALSPLLEKVTTAERQLRFGGMMGMGGGWGRGRNNDGGGSAAAVADNPVAKATQELRTVLEDKSAIAEQIASKLSALRAAREKAKEEVAKAQKELKELLTQRQEATLVMMGILD